MQRKAHQDDSAKRCGTRRTRGPLQRQKKGTHPGEHSGPIAVPCCNDLKHRDEERDKRQSHSPTRESKSLAQHLHGVKAFGPTSLPPRRDA